MNPYIDEIDQQIKTAYNWKDVTAGPIINIELTEIQSARIDATIHTLEKLRTLFMEMIADD